MRLVSVVVALTLLLGSTVRSQTITSDAFIKEAIAKEHFEPGGRYFTFNDRGTIVSRSGELIITPVHAVNVGSYSLQSATLSGTYSYVNDLDAYHPIEVHDAFANETTKTVENRLSRQGAQSSYNFNIIGSEVHPANGFDGPGGAGARDLYSYRIEGIATGVYFVSASERQAYDLADFERRVNGLAPTITSYAKAGAERFLQGLKAAGTINIAGPIDFNRPLIEQTEGRLDIFLGARDILTSPISGAVTYFAGDALAKIATEGANAVVEEGFERLPVQSQYATLGAYVGTSTYLEAHPIYGKTVDAGLTVLAATSYYKTLFPPTAGVIPRTVFEAGELRVLGWRAPRITLDPHGRLTNGKYILDRAAMVPHQTGGAGGRSQFFYRFNSDQLVMDSAAFADEAKLWDAQNKAKIVFDQPIGVDARTGSTTNVLNLYRTNTGNLHGSPGTPQ